MKKAKQTISESEKFTGMILVSIVAIVLVVAIVIVLNSGREKNTAGQATPQTRVPIASGKTEVPIVDTPVDSNSFPETTATLPSSISFESTTADGIEIYYHIRKIHDITRGLTAIVAGDDIVYTYDPSSRLFIAQKRKWTTGVPTTIPSTVLSPGKAAETLKGTTSHENLYYITADADIFHGIDIKRPSFVYAITGTENDVPVELIVDAVTGKTIGYGTPPPASWAYHTGGPYNHIPPCSPPDYLTIQMNAVLYWLNQMGYYETGGWGESGYDILTKLEGLNTPLFVEISHSSDIDGISSSIRTACYEDLTADLIASYMANVPPMPFSFLESCTSLCGTGSGTLSYSLQKGGSVGTASAGFCGLQGSACWDVTNNVIDLNDLFFEKLASGWNVDAARGAVIMAYPSCSGIFRVTGDMSLKLVPLLSRTPPDPNLGCGSSIYESTVLASDLTGCSSGVGIRASHLVFDCGGHHITGVDDPASVGIWIAPGVQEVTIKNCDISNFRTGIDDYSGSMENTISSNSIHDNEIGLLVTSDSSYIKYNTIINNQYYGLALAAQDLLISNNQVCNNQLLDIYCSESGASGSGFDNHFNIEGIGCSDLILYNSGTCGKSGGSGGASPFLSKYNYDGSSPFHVKNPPLI